MWVGANWLGSSFTEEELGILGNSRLHVGQQCILVANCIQGSISQ